MQSSDKRQELVAELKRLKAKRAEISDRDIRAALDLRINAVQEELGTEPEAVEAPLEPEVLPEPPTPEQQEAADRLIQQARLEKRRNNNAGATALLEQAAAIAPGSSAVLELIGDELSEQRKFDAAISKYAMAVRLDPKNLSVEKKHANLVFQTKAAAAGMLVSMGDYEAMASSANRAAILSLLFPSAGQFALTQYTKASVILGVWLSMLLWMVLRHNDVEGLLHSAGRAVGFGRIAGTSDYNISIVIPILIALLVHGYSVFSCRTPERQLTMDFVAGTPPKGKQKPARPTPPVNLPFE